MSKSMGDIYLEDIEKTAAATARPTIAKIKQGTRPKAVIALNPNDSYSKPFIKRLDKTLGSVSGLKRLEFVALDMMKDRQLIEQLDIVVPSLTIFKRGTQVGALPGKNTMETEIRKFLESMREHAV